MDAAAFHRSKIKIALLDSLEAGAVLTLAILAPNALRLIKYFPSTQRQYVKHP